MKNIVFAPNRAVAIQHARTKGLAPTSIVVVSPDDPRAPDQVRGYAIEDVAFHFAGDSRNIFDATSAFRNVLSSIVRF